MVSVSVMPMLDRTDKTAMGSMDEMSAPNVRASTVGIGVQNRDRSVVPPCKTQAVSTVDISVPTTAYIAIGTTCRVKDRLSMLKAASKTIGGTIIRRNQLPSKLIS